MVNSAAFSGDGKFVVTAGRDNTARLWETATGKAVGEPLRHEGEVNSAAFSPDGKFVVTASRDGTVQLWETATGKAVGEPLRYEGEVNSAAFSPDGKFVVTASEDRTARLFRWSAPLSASPAELTKLTSSIKQITLRKIAPDGGPAWISPEAPLSTSELFESFDWFAEPTRTRTVWPDSPQSVPEFIIKEIQDARRFREDQPRAKSILDNAYSIDPAHPLIHLALAMVEEDKQTAAFLRDYDLKRLPESCAYTKDLDPKEVLRLAAEMCAEQGDQKRLQVTWDKLVAAYRSAPESGTEADLSEFWARLQDNLANGRRTLARPLGGLEPLRDAVKLLREAQIYQDNDNSRYDLATALGNLAWGLLLTSQFTEAQVYCELAQELADEIGDGIEKEKREDLIYIQCNLAHALLFQGQYDQALAIYRRNWDKPVFGKTFGELAIRDFSVFDEAGLTHPDLSRMKQALGTAPQ